MNKTALVFALLLPIQVMAQVPAPAPKPTEVTGPYFGQKPPGKTPEIFAPGNISLTNRLVDNITFSPDGRECFFTVWGPNYSSAKIYWTKCVSNVWTPQVEAPFSVGHYANGPFLSMDGNKLYYGCGGTGPNGIWLVRRTAQGWGDPQRLPSPINSTYRDSAYSETADGVGYFTSNRPGGQGTTNLNDIWRTRQVPVGPLEVENLGATVNSTAADFSSCIAHDGSYLIFSSERPGKVGASDFYVSFPNGNAWTAPVNLNDYCPGINIAGCANVGPTLSSDGRYLFFTRWSKTAAGEQEDIYWVENPLSTPAPQPVEQTTLAKVFDESLANLEKQLVPAAEAMPENTYSFASTQGVRTFAQQVKHVATGNYWFASSMLGEKMPVTDDADGNGPAEHKTKAQIVQYLKDSFTYAHKAILTLNDQNALMPVKPSWGGTRTMTRLGLATLAGTHGFDHYGQMVVYLRLNGIVPPASRK